MPYIEGQGGTCLLFKSYSNTQLQILAWVVYRKPAAVQVRSKVEDAVQFKAALSRDEEWEHCNIHYAADP